MPENKKELSTKEQIQKENRGVYTVAGITSVLLLAFYGIKEIKGFKSSIDVDNDPTNPRSRAYNVEPLNMEREVIDTGIGNEPSTFEIPKSDQRILPGSRVQVVETGGLGLNIRTEAGGDSELITTAPEGTAFDVIELVEENGRTWALVKLETGEGQKEIVGYVATDDGTGPGAINYLLVIRDEPIQ